MKQNDDKLDAIGWSLVYIRQFKKKEHEELINSSRHKEFRRREQEAFDALTCARSAILKPGDTWIAPDGTQHIIDSSGNEIIIYPIEKVDHRNTNTNGDDSWEASLDELFGNWNPMEPDGAITPKPEEIKTKPQEKGSYCPNCGSRNLGFTPNLANRCKDCEYTW